MTPAENLAARLGGRWHGTYGTCRCPVHDDREPSLSIRDGDKAPLLVCHAGCDRRDIIAALRRRNLWPLEERGGDRLGKKRDPAENERLARLIWRQCRPAEGTAIEIYLQGRRITINPPPTLRYHPALRHSNTGLLLPAMVAAVQAPDRTITAIHRTYLRQDGSAKAGVAAPRKMLGSTRGGAVRLAAAGPELAVGEGLETCLAFQQLQGVPSWAALSASGLAAVVLPPLPCAAVVYVLVDLDPAGEAAAVRAAARFAGEGRAVNLVRPSTGEDINGRQAARTAQARGRARYPEQRRDQHNAGAG